jgi:hypothetical protein
MIMNYSVSSREIITSSFTSAISDTDKKSEKQRHFIAHSIVELSEFFSNEIKAELLSNLEDLFSVHGVRRDFKMKATGNTSRQMTNVESQFLHQNDRITSLYNDTKLKSLLCEIVGEEIYSCPYKPERIVATKLHKKGDTHGWHWDDYSLALVFILKAPRPDAGGILQCVPHTRWDKKSPNIISYFLTDNIRSYYFSAGSIYLMQTKTTLHRVYPLLHEGDERMILNFAYATKNELDSQIDHETVEALWNPVY